MAKLSYKVSYYLLYVLIALTIVVLALFFGVGYENEVGKYNAPQHTETLMIFMYIMFAVCVLVTVVAGGMKVALITTIFGLIVALVLQLFYNYILAKIEEITSQMEDSSITLLDIIMKYNLKYKK